MSRSANTTLPLIGSSNLHVYCLRGIAQNSCKQDRRGFSIDWMQSSGKAHPSKVVSEVTSDDLQDGVGTPKQNAVLA
jgi:hypothetical protein